MDYRFAEASDIATLVGASGIYMAGETLANTDRRERRWWERMGGDRRTVIFEDSGQIVAHLVYNPSEQGFDLEEFVVNGGGLIASEALRLLLDEILAPGAKIIVAQPADKPEAAAFWRAQGFEADRVSLSWTGGQHSVAANEN